MISQEIQEELKETIVDFRSFESSNHLHIEGRGIVGIEQTRSRTKKGTELILRGDIIITTPKGKWERIERILFHASNIFPGNREDYLFTTDKIRFGRDDELLVSVTTPHILHIQKDTGLSDEHLKRLNTLKSRNIPTQGDIAFLEEVRLIKEEHRIKTAEELRIFLASLNKAFSNK